VKLHKSVSFLAFEDNSAAFAHLKVPRLHLRPRMAKISAVIGEFKKHPKS
jgi:hypothetical protein